MRYEWDERKNRENQRKHGISFEMAALVFEDENRLIRLDRVDEYGEQRWHVIGSVSPGSGKTLVLLVVHVYRHPSGEDLPGEPRRRIAMARRSSASSARERRVTMTSEDIRHRKWTKAEKDSAERIASAQAAGDDSRIDYSDIPRLTPAQLAEMVRVRSVRKKVPVSVRLDPRVLDWLKSKGEGHLTRINDILLNLMEAEVRTGTGRQGR
jgi:uncharacterized protein